MQVIVKIFWLPPANHSSPMTYVYEGVSSLPLVEANENIILSTQGESFSLLVISRSVEYDHDKITFSYQTDTVAKL